MSETQQPETPPQDPVGELLDPGERLMPEELRRELEEIARQEQEDLKAKEKAREETKKAGTTPVGFGLHAVTESPEMLRRRVETIAEKRRVLKQVEIKTYDLCDEPSAADYAALRMEKLQDQAARLEIYVVSSSNLPDPAAPKGFRSIVIVEIRRFDYELPSYDQEFIEKSTPTKP